ncbi:MAG: amino acid adenylation domain-containing protein [Scytonema sp. RU_4_4]|nr:amino acid adenylation domain-containing protein [Scytonema sp. RU_4_4]
MKLTSFAPGIVVSSDYSTVQVTTCNWCSVQAVVCEDLSAFAEVFGVSEDSDGEAICLAVTTCVLSRYVERAEIHLKLATTGTDRATDTQSVKLYLAKEQDFPTVLGQARSVLTIDTTKIPETENESGATDAGFEFVTTDVIEPAKSNIPQILFRFVVTNSQVTLKLYFHVEVFAKEAMEHLVGCVGQIFANLAASSSNAVGEINIVAPEARRRLLVDWNGRSVAYPKDRTILQLFEDQAEATPNRIGVTFENTTLSYRSLNSKANELAIQLREAGISKGDLIPFVMNNCLELPIAVIALMKLGSVFIPIDLSWSAERICLLIDSVGPKLVIHSESDPVFDQLNVPTFAVTQADLSERDDNNHGVQIGMEDLIYGFFTSGSTGIPKCTLNIHLGLLNRFIYMSRRYQSNGRDVVLQNSKHVFDSSIWQMLWPLTNGSQVVIPPPKRLLDLSQTIEIIAANKITMTDFVPSIFNAMVNLLRAEPALAQKLRSLRQLLIGGEEISPKAVRRFKEILPHIGITNTFGPTEASIGMIFHEVTKADSQSIPIGRAIDNTYVAVLDKYMNLTPPGAVGEIYIGGDCLGVGYLKDPEKTAAAFVSNHFQEIPGEKLYRTGDLAYYRPDGMLHFVGRKDFQVKIGGIRIELTEIESVLGNHPQVRESKVLVHGDTEHKMLVAFVVAEGNLDTATLRRHVEQLLPKYSVPKKFFLLQAMPLNHNGKIDRKALADMVSKIGTNRTSLQDEIVSPQEHMIRSVWLQVLKFDFVGINDDFFTCGGDSLLALNLSLAMEKQLRVKLSVQDVFIHPTIRDQAVLLSGSNGKSSQLGVNQKAATIAAEVVCNSETVLNSLCIATSPNKQHPPKNVFLTGGTGFIGAQLLYDLLITSDVKVFCLVRDGDKAIAYEHLCDNLRHYNLWQDSFAPRIIPVIGDLSKPELSLIPEHFAQLANTIDTIIHNGAMVNFLHNYYHHRNTNVIGTVEILKLAITGKSKQVHYISTLSVFPISKSAFDKIKEETEPFDTAIPDGGYNQSKWVAEKILWQAHKHGVPLTIYRLGEVMPSSRTGIPNFKALSDTLIRGCLKLSLRFPSPIRLDYTPVDYVSRFIVALVNNCEVSHGCFHVFQPQGILLDDFLESFCQSQFKLRKVSYREFWASLRKMCVQESVDKDLMLLLTLLPEPTEEDPECSAKLTSLFTDNTLYFSCARTQALLHQWGSHWNSVEAGIFDTYAKYHHTKLSKIMIESRRKL